MDDNILYAPIKIAAARHSLTAGMNYGIGLLPAGKVAAVTFAYDPAEILGTEGCELTINEDGVLIHYNAPAGAFYAMATLVQIIEDTGADLRCDRADLILDEYRLAIELIDLAQDVGNFHYAVKFSDTAKQKTMLERLVDKLPALIEEVRRTWLVRSRYSYPDDSLAPLTHMMADARARLEALEA